MNKFRAISGPTEVIASGLVIAYAGNPITIYWDPTDLSDKGLKTIFRFTDEEGKDDARTEIKILDPTTLEINLINFKNPLGAGSSAPIEIGQLGGRKVFVHFRAYGLSKSDKTLHFSIYYEQAKEGGKNG